MKINGNEIQRGLVTNSFEVTLLGEDRSQKENGLCCPINIGSITYDLGTSSFTFNGEYIEDELLSRLLMRNLKTLAITYLLKKGQVNMRLSEVIK